LQKLGKYEILSELGHGAMGMVYKARDPLIGRLVALKTINRSLVDHPDLLERFYQEARSAGKLQHPNIVTIFELGQENEIPYIAMEYLGGESLEKTITKQMDLPLALKVDYIVRICQALEYAHKNRVVHRDIKPGNIMVNTEGVVKVVDFGIARLMDFSRTHTNMMIGTPSYMAPELFRKQRADERSDIWAVGVTFYELMCYRRPFTGDGYDIIRSIVEDEFTPPSEIFPDCPPEIEAAIQRMLTKSSSERYQSMEDVLLDLTPVWNRLRFDAASALVSRAREFYSRGDLSKAQETLRQARQIDSSNANAKTLLEKVCADLRQREILPKLQEHLNRGRLLMQSRRVHEAQKEIDAALGLDPRNEQAQELAAEIGVAAAQTQSQREIQKRVQDIRGKIERQELTDAIDLARQTLTTLGPDTDVTQLLHAAEVEQEQKIKKQESQKRVMPETEPFSPTAIQEQSPGASISTEPAPSPPPPILPKHAPSFGDAAASLASVSPRTQQAIPVLTPPPLPQKQTAVHQTQIPISESLRGVPVPRPPLSFLQKSAVLAVASVLLIAAGITYHYISATPPKPQVPVSKEVVSEKPTEAKTGSNAPGTSVEPSSAANDQIADNAFAQAMADYNRRDYAAAKLAFDEALYRGSQNWPKRSQATDFLRRTQNRLQQEQHLKQAQTSFGMKNFDDARNEASKALSAPDGDPNFKNEASQLIASIPAPGPTPILPPAKSPEAPPRNYAPVVSSVRAAIDQGRWDDAIARLRDLPPSQPEYSGLNSAIEAGRNEDNVFVTKINEFRNAEASKNESVLRISKDYFNAVAGQGGRHGTDARNLVSQIDADLKNIAADSIPTAKSPANPVALARDDAADILTVLNRFADAVSKGDIEQIKAVRNLNVSEEKRLRDTFKEMRGHGVPTSLRNCKAPRIRGDSADIACTLVSGKDNPPRVATFFLNRINDRWIIASTN
jgi:serine/threonine protein kinase